MSLDQGDQIPELRVTPDKYLTNRYAGASGDFNPIHIDAEFAKSVGLPGPILHGLYMMGLVARANAEAVGGDPRSLKRLSVQFRGMGAPETEIVVTGTVKSVEDGRRQSTRLPLRARIRPSETPRLKSSSSLLRGNGCPGPEPERGCPALFPASSGGHPSAHLESAAMLSPRQELILKLVVDAYLVSGRPVGSKEIAEKPAVEFAASTVRAELAALEAAGYLTHPHTSAGRVPSDSGYRRYVDVLLESGETGTATAVELEHSRLRREVDGAMRETTAALAQVTDLVALATAPPATAAATIHRVEVLRLRPTRVMVVAIASNGAVAKRVFDFDSAVDTGLVEWASSYLNESLTGMSVGARMIVDRLGDPDLSPVEAEFAGILGGAFTELEGEAADTLYMDGTARLLSDGRLGDLPGADKLMTALEGRASVLRMLRSALDQRSVYLWIGDENPQPELRSVSVVGANYGLAHRNLGAVGVVGPLRMDYATAIASVRVAAHELSRYCETVYG